MKGEKGNPGIGTQGPRGPPGPAGKSSYPMANCRMETPSLHIPLTLQARQMTMLHPCFHVTSMFLCYIHVANWSGRVSMLRPHGQPEQLCFPFLSREGQCVGNKCPIHQAQRCSMCWDLTVCRVRLGLGDASLMNQSPNASWTDTYPKFDVGRLTFPSF